MLDGARRSRHGVTSRALAAASGDVFSTLELRRLHLLHLLHLLHDDPAPAAPGA